MPEQTLSELAGEVLTILGATVYKPQADLVLDAKLRDLASRAATTEGELELAHETIARQQRDAAIAGGTVTADTRSIEGALIDALENELEDYQGATASWQAAHRAFDGLHARDARIAKLEQLIAAIEAQAAAGNLDAQLVIALAKYKGGKV